MGHLEQGDIRADNFQHTSFFYHIEWNTLVCMHLSTCKALSMNLA